MNAQMRLGALGQQDDDAPRGLRERVRLRKEQERRNEDPARHAPWFLYWIREYLDKGNLYPNWYPKVPREQMPSYENFLASRVWEYRNGTPFQPGTTDNHAPYVYFTTYFGSYARGFDIFKVAPIIASVALTAGAASGALAPYTVAEAGTFTAGAGAAEAVGAASAWEAATAEMVAIEGAAAEAVTSWAAASAELAAAEGVASAAISSIPSIPPASLPGGITLPSASQLAKQAAPMLLKALAPAAPTAPPRAPAPVPQALGFNAYDPYSGAYLTGEANDTMLYVLGGLALALVAAVSISQRKG